MERTDHCVSSLGLVFRVLYTTSATCSSVLDRGAPERSSSCKPGSPFSRKRRRHLPTVARVTPTAAATASLGQPSAASRIISARRTNPWERLRDLAIDSNRSRSDGLSSNGGNGRPVTIGLSFQKGDKRNLRHLQLFVQLITRQDTSGTPSEAPLHAGAELPACRGGGPGCSPGRIPEGVPTLKEPSRFPAWMGRILRNVCLNRLREDRRRRAMGGVGCRADGYRSASGAGGHPPRSVSGAAFQASREKRPGVYTALSGRPFDSGSGSSDGNNPFRGETAAVQGAQTASGGGHSHGKRRR